MNESNYIVYQVYNFFEIFKCMEFDYLRHKHCLPCTRIHEIRQSTITLVSNYLFIYASEQKRM